MLHGEYFRGTDEVWWAELQVHRGPRGVQRAAELIAHGQHLDIATLFIKELHCGDIVIDSN